MFFSPWHADTLHPKFVHLFQPITCSDEFYLDQVDPGLSQSPALLRAIDYLLVLAHYQTLLHNDHEVILHVNDTSHKHIIIVMYHAHAKFFKQVAVFNR